MGTERMSATIHRIYSRTHADTVSFVLWCGLSRGRNPNEIWGPPYQVYLSLFSYAAKEYQVIFTISILIRSDPDRCQRHMPFDFNFFALPSSCKWVPVFQYWNLTLPFLRLCVTNEDLSKGRGNGTMCKCVKVRLKPGRARWWKNWEGKKV